EISISQAPVSEGPPGSVGGRGCVSSNGSIVCVFNECDVVEREGSKATTGNVQFAILSGKASRWAQFATIHRLDPEGARRSDAKHPANRSHHAARRIQGQSGLRQQWQILKGQRSLMVVQWQCIERERVRL